MSAAKRITKKQLKDDKFVDVMLEYGEKLRQNQRLIIGVLVAVLAIIFGSSWTSNYLKSKDSESKQAFTEAMTILYTAMETAVADDYESAQEAFEALRAEFDGKQVAHWSNYLIGFCQEHRADYLNAIATYESYLEDDGNGEFALAAELGIASCNGAVGRVKPQADKLIELARSGRVGDAQAEAWLYMASQIYMDAGYFDSAQELLTELNADADQSMKRRLEQDLQALAARGS